MIRTLNVSDASQVGAMFAQTQLDHAAQEPARYRLITEPREVKSFVESQISNPDAIALGFELDERLVGYLLAVVTDIQSGGILVPKRFAMLNEIAVLDSYRRRGIADQLISGLFLRARENGATMIRATHGTFNHASARLLEKHGLQSVSVTRESNLNQQS